MRKLYLAFSALAVTCAFAGVSASPSFALTSMVLCDGLAPTSGTAAECLVTATGTLLLEESLVKPDITCSVSADLLPNAAATVPGTDILVEEVVFSGCKTSGGIGCTVTAQHLPWLSVIELEGGLFFDKLVSTGAGVPEYKATCLGISVACTAALPANGAEDYRVDLSDLEGGVLDITFLVAEEGKCGVESAGTIEG